MILTLRFGSYSVSLLVGAPGPTGGKGLAFTGAVSPTGSIAPRLTSRHINGQATPLGALQRNVLRALAGAGTPTGTDSSLKVTGKIFSVTGATSPPGDVPILALAISALEGTVTPVGALSKLYTPGSGVFFAGQSTPIGIDRNIANKALGGSTLPTSILQLRKGRAFVGATAPTGAAKLIVNKNLSGLVTPSGALLFGGVPVTAQALALTFRRPTY